MKSFILAVNEYFKAQTINGTKPHLIYCNGKYIVTWYYSPNTLNRMGGEIII